MTYQKKAELKFSGFESLADLERDVSEVIETMDIPNEYQGTLKLTFEYEPYGDECDHNWVSGDNEKVSGCEVCTKCYMIRATQEIV